MSLPVFFESPRRSLAVPVAAHLCLAKGCAHLILALALALLSTVPARAQYGGYWQVSPCDAQGNILPNPPVTNSGDRYLTGTQTGNASDTYPAALDAAMKAPPHPYGNAFFP